MEAIEQPVGALNPEFEQVRVSLDRMRTLLESLTLRGLRACGDEELAQLDGYTEELEQSGVGHVAAAFAELAAQIRSNNRAAPRSLIVAHVSVRMLERLLTLEIANAAYAMALPPDEPSDLDSEDADGAIPE
jgi:hypothetical protein